MSAILSPFRITLRPSDFPSRCRVSSVEDIRRNRTFPPSSGFYRPWCIHASPDERSSPIICAPLLIELRKLNNTAIVEYAVISLTFTFASRPACPRAFDESSATFLSSFHSFSIAVINPEFICWSFAFCARSCFIRGTSGRVPTLRWFSRGDHGGWSC